MHYASTMSAVEGWFGARGGGNWVVGIRGAMHVMLNVVFCRVHEKTMPLQCQLCGRRFKRKGNLRTHLTQHVTTMNNKAQGTHGKSMGNPLLTGKPGERDYRAGPPETIGPNRTHRRGSQRAQKCRV